MQKFNLKTLSIALITIFFVSSLLAFAQPPKAKEKFKNMKKIKLLEVLNLDEQSSDKFLAKYTFWESKLEAKKDELEKSAEELEQSIKDSQSEEEISKKTQKFLETQNELLKLANDRNQDIKQLLNKVQYGKYILFEHKFMQEVQKILFKHFKENKSGRNP